MKKRNINSDQLYKTLRSELFTQHDFYNFTTNNNELFNASSVTPLWKVLWRGIGSETRHWIRNTTKDIKND